MKCQLIKKLLALGLLFAFAGTAVISNAYTRRYYRNRYYRDGRGSRAARGGLLGGAIGAGVGGAVGGAEGAAVGAATGVAVGATAGAAADDRYYYDGYHRYDNPEGYTEVVIED